MTDPALPQSLITEIGDLKRRLDNLERSPQLLSSSITGGALRVLDSSGNEIAVLGDFTAGEGDATGIRIQNSAGADILFISEVSGFGIPRRAVPWRPAIVADFESTTSASFVDAWDSQLGVVDANGLKTQFVVTLNAADTAEVKIVLGAANTDTVSLLGSTATQWTVDLKWNHGITLGGGPILFRLQVRRSAGSGGNVNVHRPHPLEVVNSNSISATSGGLTAA